MAEGGAAKKADGGGIKEDKKISGTPVPGEQVLKEAQADSAGFKKGGKAKGDKAPPNFGKASRKAAGGAAGKFARGGSPYSAASGGGRNAPEQGSESVGSKKG